MPFCQPVGTSTVFILELTGHGYLLLLLLIVKGIMNVFGLRISGIAVKFIFLSKFRKTYLQTFAEVRY